MPRDKASRHKRCTIPCKTLPEIASQLFPFYQTAFFFTVSPFFFTVLSVKNIKKNYNVCPSDALSLITSVYYIAVQHGVSGREALNMAPMMPIVFMRNVDIPQNGIFTTIRRTAVRESTL